MEKKKSKFSLYLENLWYHEKAKIIIISVIVVFVGFAAVQCATNVTPDVYLLYAGEATVARDTVNAFDESMEKFIPEDYNGDGKIEATLESFQFGEGFIEQQKYFDAEIYGGKTVILLLSPECYEYCKNSNYLVTLKEALGEKPEVARDNYSINFYDLECATEMGLTVLPDETVVCLAAPRSDGKTAANYDQIKFLKHMLETK